MMYELKKNWHFECLFEKGSNEVKGKLTPIEAVFVILLSLVLCSCATDTSTLSETAIASLNTLHIGVYAQHTTTQVFETTSHDTESIQKLYRQLVSLPFLPANKTTSCPGNGSIFYHYDLQFRNYDTLVVQSTSDATGCMILTVTFPPQNGSKMYFGVSSFWSLLHHYFGAPEPIFK